MFDIARVLLADKRLQPVMVLSVPQAVAWEVHCQRAEIPVVNAVEGLVKARQSAMPRLQALLLWLDNWIGTAERATNYLPIALLRICLLRHQLRRERKVFVELLRRVLPVAVLVPGDRELSPVPALLRAALDEHVPSVNTALGSPYTEGLEQARCSLTQFKVARKDGAPILNRYVARRFPRQVRQTAWGPLLFSPGWLVLALAGEGMLSANPWVQGGGNSTYHLQHDQSRMKEFARLGSPQEKMVFVGDPAMDLLFKSYTERSVIRMALVSEHGLDPTRPLVVVSVPNDAEHGVCGWDEHLNRLDAYLGPLAQEPVNVILSLHPKSNPAAYQTFARRHGFAIVASRLYEFLPAADIYVCSGSSTVLWARVCAVPVINLDYLHIRDGDYHGVSAVINVETVAEFMAAVRHWREGCIRKDDLEVKAAQLAADTLFDGLAGERICNFLWQLATAQNSPD
jgi:hypothetical protein